MSEEEVWTEELRVDGDGLVEKVKELVREGNVRHISIKNREGRTVVDIPLTLGVIGSLAAPKLAALAAIAVLAGDCTIVVQRVAA